MTIEQLKTTTVSKEIVADVKPEEPPQTKKQRWKDKLLTIRLKRRSSEATDKDDNGVQADEEDDENFDWWTKYYASTEVPFTKSLIWII